MVMVGTLCGYFCPNGPIAYMTKSYGKSKFVSTPRAGVMLPWALARVRAYKVVREEEIRMETVIPAAATALAAGEISRAKALLEPFAESGMLARSETALRLWTELSHYYSRTALLAIVPTKDAPIPDPASFIPDPAPRKAPLNCADNGVLFVHTNVACLLEHEDYSGDLYADIEWSLTGFDSSRRQQRVFFLPKLDEDTQRNEDRWDTEVTPSFGRDGRLYWPHYQRNYHSRGSEGVDLADPKTQREMNVVFDLPAGEKLCNTRDGLRIGRSLFWDDEFVGCYPLWYADIIPGKQRNYRLVWRYGDTSLT